MPQKPLPIILELVEHFERNIESYRSPAYNEAQVRQEFINPFFEALGWDVANKERHAEAYKDVIHEDAIKVGAPDYCFRIGGARKFFLEAKKPAVNIKDDPDPAYQLRRYAWSAKLPLSILTDFEEFAVYDCRARPSPSDKASAGRIHYLTYKEYATRWDEIASVFSKDAVLKGSFDKYAVSERKRGTTTVDAEFLAEIEKWREDLAKNLAVRNTALDVHELNFAVQRTIDRLIFLRICEDRGIEPYAQLQALLNGENIYGRLRHLYDQADDRYNSGLFHFRSEKERAETPDELTPTLKIDDKVLKDIIHGLYYPESPYEFSVMPAEILGQVYEQFLGKVIRLTSGHQAKVEEKPEVKKAGGVYYTPAYIVAYIVRNTVGTLCKGKTPKHISKLKILDPACGSGSFLIGAYDYLVAYHRDWYLKDGAEKHTKEIYQGAGGLWHLATQEKKRILLNNIYGVDIDSQAVEVTKLSLLLKVLEGENQETLKKQLKMWHERALPDLGRNIKCGNSLIGPDYFSGQLIPDDDEMRRVNPFDWNAEFPEIMKADGFDAVIGNPPYVDSEEMVKSNPILRAYAVSNYQVAKGNWDLFCIFLERAIKLTRKSGRASMIIPNKLLSAEYAQATRQLLSSTLVCVRDYSAVAVFEGVGVYPVVVVMENSESRSVPVIFETMVLKEHAVTLLASRSLSRDQLSKEGSGNWAVNLGGGASILKKLNAIPVKLESVAYVGGAATVSEAYALKPFLKDMPQPSHESVRFINTGTIDRFESLWGSYKTRYIKDSYQCPVVDRKKLAQHFPKRHEQSQQAKIVVGGMTKVLECFIDIKGSYLAGKSTTIVVPKKISILYLGGLLNSSLLTYCFKEMFRALSLQGGFFRIGPPQLKQLPISFPDLLDSADKAKHDKMVALVERMLDLHQRMAKAKAPDDKTKLQRQIDATDQEIDRLVYDLYGLTEEEIGIVEGKTS